MSTDRDLLRAYAETCSEAAFAELVKRYANLVYSVGLRKCADPTLAEDVTQQVFIDLGRKAGSLSAVVVLSAWLHRAACYAAAEECRARHRREKREQVATEMNLLDSETDPPWSAIKPELDDALNELASADREALLLRFFEQRSHAQIGLAFQVSEDAARKRVDRALDRLRSVLAGRGVTASAAALSAALIANSIQAAPATFIAGLTTASLAGFGGKTTTLTLSP